MIDALIAGQFRSHGVQMGVVRSAYDHLSAQFGDHPFCHQDLFTDGQQIIVRTASELGNSAAGAKLREAVSGQTLFAQIQNHLAHIRYSPNDQLAESWRIADGIVIDPAICYGRPSICNRGISAFVLAKAYWANHEDEELVADLFEIDTLTVQYAVSFEKRWREAA